MTHHVNLPVIVAFAEARADLTDDTGRCARDALKLASELASVRVVLRDALGHLGDHHRFDFASDCPVCRFVKMAGHFTDGEDR